MHRLVRPIPRRQPDQRIGGHAVDRRHSQPGHPPELASQAPHHVADRAARRRPAESTPLTVQVTSPDGSRQASIGPAAWSGSRRR